MLIWVRLCRERRDGIILVPHERVRYYGRHVAERDGGSGRMRDEGIIVKSSRFW